jgi:hypothetical protein
MNFEILAAMFGGLLLLVAIVGGGFELREIKVPKVGWLARSAAAVVGGILIVFALPEPAPQAYDPPVPPTSTVSVTTPAPSVDFTIADALGEGQITEQIKVHVDGRLVGTLTVDIAHSTSTLTVTVPKAGRYSYTLSSLSTFELDDGEVAEISGYGHGQVDIIAGKALEVRYEVGQDQLDLTLE